MSNDCSGNRDLCVDVHVLPVDQGREDGLCVLGIYDRPRLLLHGNKHRIFLYSFLYVGNRVKNGNHKLI